MNLVIFCAICLLPTSLAFGVRIYEDLMKPPLVCTQHRFVYQRGDNFTMDIVSYLAVTNATAVVKQYTGSRFSDNEFPIVFMDVFGTRLKFSLNNDRIVIDVELITDDGCQRHTILEGTRRLVAMNKTTNSVMCLNENFCIAVISEGDKCRDIKPQVCEIMKNSNPLVTPEAPLDKRQKSLNDDYDLLTLTPMLNIFDATTISQKNTDSQSTTETSQDVSCTQCAKDNSKDAETSYFTVMIVSSSIAAVTLVSLLIISIRYFCWKKYNSPGLQQILPTNENRYYENIVFGPDCLQEINQQEQRASEPPPPEAQYEEINNYLNHG